jgi:hypothetical protein
MSQTEQKNVAKNKKKRCPPWLEPTATSGTEQNQLTTHGPK